MTSDTLLLMLLVVNDKPFATMLHSSGSGSSSTQSVLLLPMLDDGEAIIEVMLMSVDEAAVCCASDSIRRGMSCDVACSRGVSMYSVVVRWERCGLCDGAVLCCYAVIEAV
jgi:hypothetical protein